MAALSTERRTRWRRQRNDLNRRALSTAWAAQWSMRANCCVTELMLEFCTGCTASFSSWRCSRGCIYLPWIFRFFTPLFGGGAMTRLLHPWFGLGFVFFFMLQV